mgnify:CR=1 FL=1
MPLETESRAQIRALVSEFRPNHGDLLAALHRVQHEYGYLSREAMEVVGEQLGLFAAQVYGAASYYEEFRFEPPAAVKASTCSAALASRPAPGVKAPWYTLDYTFTMDAGKATLPRAPIHDKAKSMEARPEYLAAVQRAPSMAK